MHSTVRSNPVVSRDISPRSASRLLFFQQWMWYHKTSLEFCWNRYRRTFGLLALSETEKDMNVILNRHQYSFWCPETLFISYENTNLLFAVFRVVQGEAKTPKIMGCCRANFAFLHALKTGTFRGKWTLEWVINTSNMHFVRLLLYILITSKLAFSFIASQQCLAETEKNVWVRAQNNAIRNFLPLRLETYFFSLSLFLSQ